MMPENEPRPKLSAVLQGAWDALAAGAEQGRHPFHTPALASAGEAGPAVRTVVLRQADEEQRWLVCHTDLRSPKVALFRDHPRAAWMFYDREAKTQIRASGPVTLHHGDEVAKARWEASREQSRRCYHAALGPGAPLDSGGPRDDLAEGFGQFVVLRCRVEVMDWLYLRAQGHWRARFEWVENRWQGQWIAP
ncbi:MAG: pyridoxamine 5'-phosphate oxidase family protein [Gammaproteobacteria bacterium]